MFKYILLVFLLDPNGSTVNVIGAELNLSAMDCMLKAEFINSGRGNKAAACMPLKID